MTITNTSEITSSPRRTGFLPVLCTAGVFLAGAASSRAAIAVSNTGEFLTGVDTVADMQAVQFTTGAGAGWTLDSITVPLGRPSGVPDEVTGTLFADFAGLPGSAVAGALGTATVTGNGDYTFTSATPITLTPNTAYWFAVSNGDPNSGTPTLWYYTSSANQTGLPGWDVGHVRANGINNGAGGWNISGFNSAYMLTVDVTPIPEPSGLMLALAGTGLVLRRRRTR